MLSPSDLGITEAEHAALQVVRDGLANGRFIHVMEREVSENLNILSNPETTSLEGERFAMTESCVEGSCGTVACIGGWVAKIMGYGAVGARRYVHECFMDTSPLRPLYYPYHVDEWDFITPDVAARAITTFLDSGDVDYPALIGVAR